MAQRAARNPSQSASKPKSKRSRQPAADQGDGSQRISSVAGSLAHAPRHEREPADQGSGVSPPVPEDVVQLIGDGILLLSKDLRILWANRAAVEQTGRELDELLGSHCYEATHHRDSPCEPPPEPCPVQLLLRTGEPATAIHTHFNVAGNQRRVEVAVYPLTDEGGEIVKFVHVCRDVTERKQAEEALRRSEEHFRSLIENASDLIVVLDARGTVRYESPSVGRILGYESGYLVGRNVSELIHPDDVVDAANAIVASIEDPIPEATRQFRARHRDGSWRFLEAVSSVLDDGSGVPLIVVNSRDITERKRAEEEVLRQRAVLEAINEVFRETLACETDADVARKCLEVAERLTDSQFGFIGEINQAGRFDSIALTDPGWDACTMPRSNAVRMINDMEIRGFWGRVLRDGKPLIVNDPASHPDRVGTPDGHPSLTSFLGVPMKRRGKTIGMFALANKESGYDVADQEDLEALSVAFVEALNRKRAEQALSRQAEIDSALAELGEALIHPASIEDISSLVLEYAKRLTGSAFGFVGYIDPRTGYLVSPTLTTDVWDECQVPGKTIVFKTFGGLWGWVLENRKPLLTNAPSDDPRSVGTPQGHVPIHRFLSAPALLDETTVGQVAVANSDRDYSERDLEVVERLATLYALAVQRKRMETQLEEALGKAREGLEISVERRLKRRNVYGLTFRELTVLRMITAGQTDRGIAVALGISHLTAQKHTSNILRKMEAASRTEAGARAIREGLVD